MTHCVPVHGASFRNLGFEEANTNGLQLVDSRYGPQGSGPVSDLLPGWQLSCGSNIVEALDINVVPLEGPFLSLFAGLYGSFVEGNYALGISEPAGPCSLVQRGEVPADARLLRFRYLSDPLSAELNGEALNSIVPLSSALVGDKFANFNLSAYRGREVQLKLTQMKAADGDPARIRLLSTLDSIEFAPAGKADFWFRRDTASTNARLFRAAGTNGSWVAVGWSGAIYWSADGQRWTQQESPATSDLYGITYANGRWVAVGYPATILTSDDGRQWTARATNMTSGLADAPSFSAVTHALGLFVAVGGQTNDNHGCLGGGPKPLVWTSPDGISWTDRSPISTGFLCPGSMYDVIYTPEKQAFVAVGEGILVSANGLNWFQIYATHVSPRPVAGDFYSITFGRGQFVATKSGQLAISTNAADWSGIETLQRNFACNAVAFFDDTFWAAGRTEGGTDFVGTILRSADAKRWYPVDGLDVPSFDQIWGLSVAGDSLLALGGKGLLLQSASVASPPQFRAWETRVQTNGAVALTLDVAPGSIVSVDSSSDLKTWSPLQLVTNTTTRAQIEDPGAGGAKRFYRASAN